MYLLGQICGLIGTLITVLMPQCKKKTHMSFCTAAVNGLNALNFTLIGELGSSVFLCLVAVIQSFVSVWHEKRKTEVSTLETILFFLLYVGFGFYGMMLSEGFQWAINGKFLLELLPITGAVFSMLFVSTRDESIARRYLMVCNIMWATYHTIIRSTSVFGAIFSGVSCMIAIIRDKKNKAKQAN